MSADRDPDSVFDIVDSLRMVMSYTEGMSFGQFIADIRTLDAVTRRIEIIGEATKRLTEKLRADHPEIPWRKMSGTRDRLVHNYDKIDPEVIWEIAKRLGPELLPKLEAILKEIGDLHA